MPINTRILFFACLIVANGGLGATFALRGERGAALAALLAGLAWALPELSFFQKAAARQRQGWLKDARWLSNLCFGLTALLAALCVLVGYAWWLALALLAAALAAWDLFAFRQRVFAGRQESSRTVLRAYRRANPVATSAPETGPEPVGEALDESAMSPEGALQAMQAERLAFEAAHLRMLGWVILGGLAGAGLIYTAAGWLRFPSGLSLALALSLGLVILLIGLARVFTK